jgi:hypothetical protein
MSTTGAGLEVGLAVGLAVGFAVAPKVGFGVEDPDRVIAKLATIPTDKQIRGALQPVCSVTGSSSEGFTISLSPGFQLSKRVKIAFRTLPRLPPVSAEITATRLSATN